MWHTPRFLDGFSFPCAIAAQPARDAASHRRRSAVFRLERLEDRTVLSSCRRHQWCRQRPRLAAAGDP